MAPAHWHQPALGFLCMQTKIRKEVFHGHNDRLFDSEYIQDLTVCRKTQLIDNISPHLIILSHLWG